MPYACYNANKCIDFHDDTFRQTNNNNNKKNNKKLIISNCISIYWKQKGQQWQLMKYINVCEMRACVCLVSIYLYGTNYYHVSNYRSSLYFQIDGFVVVCLCCCSQMQFINFFSAWINWLDRDKDMELIYSIFDPKKIHHSCWDQMNSKYSLWMLLYTSVIDKMAIKYCIYYIRDCKAPKFSTHFIIENRLSANTSNTYLKHFLFIFYIRK